MKALFRLTLVLMLSGCMAESDLPPLPTLVEFPTGTANPTAEAISQTASEIPTEISPSPEVNASPTTFSSPTADNTVIWLSLEGAKAYACPSVDCVLVLELPIGLRFVSLETVNDWHTVRLDATQLVYIPSAFTRLLTEADLRATGTAPSIATETISPTANISISSSNNPLPAANNSSNSVGSLPLPISAGQNPASNNTAVPSPTPLVVNTRIPTQDFSSGGDLTSLPPSPTNDENENLPVLASLTPTNTPPPPPLIVLPLAN